MPLRSNSQSPVRHDIECEVDGQVHRGTYTVDRGMMTVSSGMHSKTASPGARPEAIARIILRELVQEAKGRGW